MRKVHTYAMWIFFMIPSVCLSCLPEAFKSLSKSGIAQDSGGYDPEPH